MFYYQSPKKKANWISRFKASLDRRKLKSQRQAIKKAALETALERNVNFDRSVENG